ncbi:hypothetical protein LCGC14_0508710 [marine sediment metagenome]|uniref:Glycosyltransferase 2-like domain-containing protein n=1 Tax=marine sediment metagenome TaxID=412755 RepID=A0A0F9SK87_9ZZZZ
MAKKKKSKNKRKRRHSGSQAKPQESPLAENTQVLPYIQPLLDIIVPVYGEWALAESAIKSIEAGMKDWGSPEYNIIVLDNGTPEFNNDDGTTISPETQSAGVKKLLRKSDKLVRLEENRGFPGGINFAVSKGKAPLILILSADIVLLNGAITNLINEMDNPEIGVVGIKLLFPEQDSPHGPPGSVQHAGHAVDISGKIIHIYLGWSRNNPKVNTRKEMASITGSCFITRRGLWTDIGGLHEGYGKGTFEDVDYCFNARAHGKKVVYSPQSEAYHIVGGSIIQGAGSDGFNLAANEQIFRGRWVNGLEWDVYRYL